MGQQSLDRALADLKQGEFMDDPLDEDVRWQRVPGGWVRTEHHRVYQTNDDSSESIVLHSMTTCFVPKPAVPRIHSAPPGD